MTMIRHLLLLTALLAAPLAPAATPSGEAAARVETRPLAEATIHPLREASAIVIARNEARIAAETGGRLLRWTHDVGQRVGKGELLAEIDPADAQLARERARTGMAAAQARLSLSELQLQRARDLVAQGFYAREALNQRETEAQLLRSELATQGLQLSGAELQLARTRVLAPFAGVVKQRMAQTGETVAPGTPLFVLVEQGSVEVGAALASAEIDSLRAAGAWTLVLNGSQHALRLLRVSTVVSAPARTVEVRFAGVSADLAAGAEGRLQWRDPRPHVPPSLLVRRLVNGVSQLGVFVADAGVARFVALPGAQEGRAAVVTLAKDSQLVVRGQQALNAGQRLAASAAR